MEKADKSSQILETEANKQKKYIIKGKTKNELQFAFNL